MKLEDRNIEDIDMKEDYEMVPLEPMMYGYDQMNMMPNMGMPMGCMQNVNPNMGMSPNMGMNPNMGMYPYMGMYGNMEMNPNMGMYPNMGMSPYMGMNQFNEGMFMDGFNPMGMMYGDVSMNDNEDEDEGSRHLDNQPFKDGYNNPHNPNNPNNPNIPHNPNPKYNEVDFIVRRIERYNPAIFRRLTRCGIPYAEAREIVRRIVRLTLMYSEQ